MIMLNIKTNRVHLYSGLVLTLFIGIHLFNHLMSIYGVETHIELMNKFRIVYRNPIIEIFLMLAVVIQITTGIKLFFFVKRRTKPLYKKLQIWTGLYLAFFLLIHVSVVMIGRFFLNMDTNIYFGSAGLNTFPFLIFFIPYYCLAILSFFGHISAIHFEKMNNKVFGLSVNQQSKLILIIGILLTLIIIYGLTNKFTGLNIPTEYNLLIGK